MKQSLPPQQFLTDKNGRKTAVIISTLDYQELIEDLEDLKIIAERKKEKTITLEDLKAKLKK